MPGPRRDRDITGPGTPPAAPASARKPGARHLLIVDLCGPATWSAGRGDAPGEGAVTQGAGPPQPRPKVLAGAAPAPSPGCVPSSYARVTSVWARGALLCPCLVLEHGDPVAPKMSAWASSFWVIFPAPPFHPPSLLYRSCFPTTQNPSILPHSVERRLGRWLWGWVCLAECPRTLKCLGAL